MNYMHFFNRHSTNALAKFALCTSMGLAPIAAVAQTGKESPPRPGFALAMEDDGDEMNPANPGPPMGPMDGMDGMAPVGAAMKDGPPKGCCGMSMGKPMGGMANDKMSMSGGPASMKGSPTAGSQAAEAPHLLHAGAKDFFLDQARRINLTPEQKLVLGKIKADAVNAKVTWQKGIDVAQQELWQLTSADPADPALIDSKVQEIGKLTADQQISFIHSVEEAATVLDDQQKKAVVKSAAAVSTPKMPKSGSMKKSM